MFLSFQVSLNLIMINLTLVDLPGIIRNSESDQNGDIELELREMILNCNPSCLILAVSPANADLKTSDSLHLTKIVDPNHERTIGVITKLDLMDEGTDCFKELTNKVLRLKRGYIGVVNRSQMQIDKSLDMESALKAEEKFFKMHPKYASIARKHGTMYLRTFLNHQLGEHIRSHLPGFADFICREQIKIEERLNSFFVPPETNAERLRLMAKIIRKVVEHVDDQLGNNLARATDNVSTDSLNVAAEMWTLFHKDFAIALKLAQVVETEEMREIFVAIRNTKDCVNLGMCITHRYQTPEGTEKLVLFNMEIGNSDSDEEQGTEFVFDYSQQRQELLKAMYLAGFYPNNRRGDFGVEEFERAVWEFRRWEFRREAEAVREMVEEYMAAEVKTLETIMPKITIHLVVDQFHDFLTCDLQAELQDKAVELMEESPRVAQERSELENMHERYQNFIALTEEFKRASDEA
ncbi:hypothetical protein L596_014388 [Steinernema carpocapsae]|uniref:dynamin GTPase n=1 Tax=Steinernema carpocapsae TaxID=34508 RepID=A0A4U5NCC8_STECR|nr:hypothetical protein L596_014388 [Steinernema carpocapsae]